MKKLKIVLALCCLLSGCEQPQNEITTLILMRHAEKDNDGTKDPGLTEEGRSRAQELVKILGDTKIDAIYSTAYKRTNATVEALAISKALSVVSYDPMNGAEMDKILQKFNGGTVILCGHSNTTPWVANYFLGREELTDFKDSDYDNLILLSVVAKGNAKLTWFTYGDTH